LTTKLQLDNSVDYQISNQRLHFIEKMIAAEHFQNLERVTELSVRFGPRDNRVVGNRLTMWYVATSTNCSVLHAKSSVMMMIWRVEINRPNTSQKKATVYNTADKCAQHFSGPILRCNPPESGNF
jgi:hypothetical protein